MKLALVFSFVFISFASLINLGSSQEADGEFQFTVIDLSGDGDQVSGTVNSASGVLQNGTWVISGPNATNITGTAEEFADFFDFLNPIGGFFKGIPDFFDNIFNGIGNLFRF